MWAGLPVQMQIIATDLAGYGAKRQCGFHLAGAGILPSDRTRPIIKRKKLLQNLLDDAVRSEAAPTSWPHAHQPASYHM